MTAANTHPAAVIRIGDQPQAAVRPACAASQEPACQAESIAAAATSRTTFGDLAASASRFLQAPAQRLPVTCLPSPGQVAAQADEFLTVLPRLLKTIGRYAADIAAATTPATGQDHEQASPWARAAAEARRAAQNAFQALPAEELLDRPWLHRPKTSSLTRDLDAAATAITAARDLLQTHFETSADGSRRDRTEWAPIISSSAVRKALLAELAGWSRHIVSHGARITSANPRDGSGLTSRQRRVLAICRSLTVLITSVDSAHNREQVTGEEVWQLYRIPVSMFCPRNAPSRAETVPGLQRGTIECAERVRSAAAASVTDAAWSPVISPESFTQTAMHAAAISGHCEILLQLLAARAAQLGATRPRRDLLTSAAAAARARRAWLAAARAWYHFKTDAPGELSQAAQEVADLAQWTGRLSYADPPLALMPEGAPGCRPPQQLAPDPGAFTRTLTAVHQAASTMTALATAGYSQIRAAARNGRLLVPAVQIPGSAQDATVYARARRSGVNILLAAYRDAGTASIKATASISRITAQPGAADGHDARSPRGSPGDRPVPGRLSSAAFMDPGEDLPPGPIERIVYDLGVTQPDLLSRAIALDKSVSQLVADAADRTAPQRWHSAAIRPGAVTSQAAVTRQVLGAGQPAPAASLHRSLRTLAAADLHAQPEPRNRSRGHTASSGQATPPVLPRAA